MDRDSILCACGCGNLITLCPNHHRLAHAGIISLEAYRSPADETPTPDHVPASH